MDEYSDVMANEKRDWSRFGQLRILKQDGKFVSYDNSRFVSARNVRLKCVPIQIVNPVDPYPASTTGRTWAEKFEQRMTNKLNQPRVPSGGLSSIPKAR